MRPVSSNFAPYEVFIEFESFLKSIFSNFPSYFGIFEVKFSPFSLNWEPYVIKLETFHQIWDLYVIEFWTFPWVRDPFSIIWLPYVTKLRTLCTQVRDHSIKLCTSWRKWRVLSSLGPVWSQFLVISVRFVSLWSQIHYLFIKFSSMWPFS